MGPGVANGINNAGFVVGGGPEGGFAWKHGQLARLSFGGVAVNDNFQIIGGDASGPLLWSNGEITRLPFYPTGLNNAGDVVGNNIGLVDPQIWQNGKANFLQDLLIDSQGYTLSNARAINDAGQIVGTIQSPTQGPFAYRLDPVGDAPAWMGWALGLEKKDPGR